MIQNNFLPPHFYMWEPYPPFAMFLNFKDYPFY